MTERLKPQLLDPEEIAGFVGVEREQVYKWMAEDRIPYADLQNGEYKIPLHGFQAVMPQLFDLEADLKAIHDAASGVSEASIERFISRD